MLLFFIIASLLTLNASADNKEIPSMYVRLDIGASFPSGSFDKIKNPYYDDKVDRAWFSGIGIGYAFNSNIRTDLVLTNRYLYRFHATEDQGTDTVSTKQNFGNTSLMANLYYDFNNTSIITPYINFGIGASCNRNGDYNQSYNNAKHITTTSGKNYDFAWNAGIGLQTKLTQGFYADLFFRYIDLGKFEDKSYNDLISGATETSSPGSIQNKELGLSLIYKF